MRDVAIVIPIYRDKLSRSELIALTQGVAMFASYHIFLLCPDGLDTRHIDEYGSFRKARFSLRHFHGIDSYSRLLLNVEFYKRFIDYEYLLIYQLDAFVFSDELEYWSGLGYDYIGAPWFGKYWPEKLMSHAKKRMSVSDPAWMKWHRALRKVGVGYKNDNLVGNGGFSLRKVKSALRVLELMPHQAGAFPWNEDCFWGVFVPNSYIGFRKPDRKLASYFALELEPLAAVERNEGKMPFGCHGWERWALDFWRPHIQAFGHQI